MRNRNIRLRAKPTEGQYTDLCLDLHYRCLLTVMTSPVWEDIVQLGGFPRFHDTMKAIISFLPLERVLSRRSYLKSKFRPVHFFERELSLFAAICSNLSPMDQKALQIALSIPKVTECLANRLPSELWIIVFSSLTTHHDITSLQFVLGFSPPDDHWLKLGAPFLSCLPSLWDMDIRPIPRVDLSQKRDQLSHTKAVLEQVDALRFQIKGDSRRIIHNAHNLIERRAKYNMCIEIKRLMWAQPHGKFVQKLLPGLAHLDPTAGFHRNRHATISIRSSSEVTYYFRVLGTGRYLCGILVEGELTGFLGDQGYCGTMEDVCDVSVVWDREGILGLALAASDLSSWMNRSPRHEHWTTTLSASAVSGDKLVLTFDVSPAAI